MSTWIFLRGLTREAAHWGTFPGAFVKAVPKAKVVMLDLPGNGERHGQRSPLSVQAMVQACREDLRRRGVSPPFHLLAMSLGAMVATEWASRAPDEVAGSVLINTSFRPFSPFYQRLRPANYGHLVRLALLMRNPHGIESMVWRLTSNISPPGAAVLSQWVNVRVARPVSAANTLRQLWAAARYQAPALAPVPDLLLLNSAQDHLVHSACSRAIAGAWQVPLVVHPTAGHDLPLDDPAWVAEQVRHWLADASAPS